MGHLRSGKTVGPPKKRLPSSTVTCPDRLVGRANIHTIKLNGASCSALIDTGSQVSLISSSLYEQWFGYLPLITLEELADRDIRAPIVKSVSGEDIHYIGALELRVTLGQKLAGISHGVDVLFLVLSDAVTTRPTHDEHFCLIGMNAIESCYVHCDRDDETTCFLDFAYANLLRIAEVEDSKDGILGTARLASELELKPGQVTSVKCTFRSKIVGCRATVLIEACNQLVDLQTCLRDADLKSLTRVHVPVANNSDMSITVAKGTTVGKVYLAGSPFHLDEHNIEVYADCGNISLQTHTETEEFLKTHGATGLLDPEDQDLTPDMKQLWEHVDTQKGHLTIEQHEDLVSCLHENLGVFSKSEYDIGKVKNVKHQFVLSDDIPFKVRHRNLPPRMYTAAKDHINQLLQKGIIRHSNSPYSSAPLFIQKPDGRVRMVTDLRYLNAKTVRDNYALPRIDDILPHLAGHQYFTKMDIRSGYYNIEIEERDKEKTAFSTPFGLYEYNRMVQGAKTSAATFQRCMENILKPLLYEGVIAFLDDVIIYTKTVAEHLVILNKALKLMQEAGLKIHPGKCTILAKEILYLGHTISHEGVKANPDKTKVLQDWPKIKTVRDLMSFLGFCGYFRRHIPHFAQIAKPLVALTQGVKYRPKDPFGPPTKQPALEKDITSVWTVECQQAREELIKALSEPPCLKLPDMGKTFILHVDASTTGLGAVLLQFDDDKKLHPVCYASRALKKAECNYPVYKLEFLALKWAVVDKFSMYLYGGSFKVYTDNNPLTYIHTTLKVDATSQRWLSALGDYDFTIHYKPGTMNVDADVLSRLQYAPEVLSEHITAFMDGMDPLVNYVDVTRIDPDEDEDEEVEVCAMRSNLNWAQIQKSDLEFMEVIRRVEQRVISKPCDFPRTYRKLFFVRDQMYMNDSGILCKKAMIFGQEHELIVLPHGALPLVLHALHDESGHFGVERTASLFRRRFYYPGYAQAICDYIGSCASCIAKKTVKKKRGFLGEVTASRPFETVSMDFLSIETDKNGYGHVLVVTDVFTKYAFAFPTKNEKALTVAKILVEKVFSVFGLPQKLLSDRGRNFESRVIEQLCKLLQIKKVFTCPYNPKSDSVCERFNRTLIGMLGTLKEEKRNEWHKYVPHLVGVYNSTQHSSTGFSPFELMFGRKSRLPVDQYLGTTPVEAEFDDVSDYVLQLKERMEFVHTLAKQSLDHKHLVNKERYDENVKSEQLQPGDWVFVKNVGVKGMHKLAPTYLPEVYQVVRMVDENPRVFEIRNLTFPRRRNRILHVDMMLKVTGIEEKFKATHLPKYGLLDDKVQGEEIERLFEEGGFLPSPVLDGVTDKETKARRRNPGRKAKSGSSSKIDKKEAEDDVSESESDDGIIMFNSKHPEQEPPRRFSVPQHVSPRVLRPRPPRRGVEDEVLEVNPEPDAESDSESSDDEEALQLEEPSVESPDEEEPARAGEPDLEQSAESVEEEVGLDELPKEEGAVARSIPKPASATGKGGLVQRDDYPKRDRGQPDWYGNPVPYALGVHGFFQYLGPIIHV